jgi:hypothetical protein
MRPIAAMQQMLMEPQEAFLDNFLSCLAIDSQKHQVPAQ